jgi:uncharacterized protein (DUF2267 family)
MTTASVDAIERSVHKTNEWLNQLAQELGAETKDDVWPVLRGYLQVLRERLTLDEAAQLAAQFPHVIRGVFYEGFDPGHQPHKIRDREAFLQSLMEHGVAGDMAQAQIAATAATRVMREHVSEGEFEDAIAQLPPDIREVLVA